MTKPNMFNLDKIIQELPEPDYTSDIEVPKKPKKTSGSSELNSKYEEVPLTDISEILPGTSIKYKDSEGKIQTAGKFDSVNGDVCNFNFFLATKRIYVPKKVKIADMKKIFKYLPTEGKLPGETIKKKDSESQADTKSQASVKTTRNTQEDILSQIGNKVLFNDTELMNQRIIKLEADVEKIHSDMKKMFTLIKRLYKSDSA